jgi:hypothetical protein
MTPLSRDRGSFQSLPQWFIAIAALIYATGFLVVFSFFERFGLRETGVEFFKAKFFHVGILCLMFPVIVLVPPFAFVGIKRVGQIIERRGVKPPDLLGHGLFRRTLVVRRRALW